jgi:hypothetical protein
MILSAKIKKPQGIILGVFSVHPGGSLSSTRGKNFTFQGPGRRLLKPVKKKRGGKKAVPPWSHPAGSGLAKLAINSCKRFAFLSILSNIPLFYLDCQ